MERRYLYALAILAVLAVGVVNATVFAYRWMMGYVRIFGAEHATGAACTGFYSSATQPGIPLRPVGRNADAQTFGSNAISISPGQSVCQWTVGVTPYYLYESITVTIPVTVGSWYIQDFYGFGYYNRTATDPQPLYVYIRVDSAVNDTSVLRVAKLVIYYWNNTYITTLDLTVSGAQTPAIVLNRNESLRLDLYLDANVAGAVEFKVGVYVTQEADESPVTPTP